MLGWEGKSGVVQASQGKLGFENNKKNTIEANMLLKTKRACAKRTQNEPPNEPHLSAKMRESRVEFEFSGTSQVLAEASNGKDARGGNRPVGALQKIVRKYENRGNKAKKCLKTKDITFLKVANFACFVRKSTAISPQREQMTPHFVKTKSGRATRSVTA